MVSSDRLLRAINAIGDVRKKPRRLRGPAARNQLFAVGAAVTLSIAVRRALSPLVDTGWSHA